MVIFLKISPSILWYCQFFSNVTIVSIRHHYLQPYECTVVILYYEKLKTRTIQKYLKIDFFFFLYPIIVSCKIINLSFLLQEQSKNFITKENIEAHIEKILNEEPYSYLWAIDLKGNVYEGYNKTPTPNKRLSVHRFIADNAIPETIPETIETEVKAESQNTFAWLRYEFQIIIIFGCCRRADGRCCVSRV